MEMTVYEKEVYGRVLVYPVNRTAVLLAALTGAKTFAESDLRIVRDLGYSIRYVTRQEYEQGGKNA